MSVKTKLQLLLDAETFLPDNTTEDISASDVRNRLVDIIDSLLIATNGFQQGGNSFTAAAVLGTNDEFGLNFKTNDIVRGGIDINGFLNIIKGFKRNAITLDDRKAIILKDTTVATFGDSITDSYGVAAGYGWQDIFSSILGTTLSNQAVSGRGVYKAVENAYVSIDINTETNSCWMAGFNDLRRSATAGTYNKLKGSLRAFLANQFLKTGIAANDGDVTQTGTWTELLTNVIGDKAYTFGGTALYSSTVNDTLEYTFTGNSLVIGTWAVDGVNEFGGTFTVDIDGTVVDTYTSTGQTDGVSDGTYNNQRTPTALVYQNLGNGSHTVIIKITAVAGGGNVYIDYFGTLRNPTECSSVLVFDIPKMNTAGYAEVPNYANDDVFNLGDIAQGLVISEFESYPVFRVYTNDFYDIVTGLSSDDIHPNEKGYAQIARAATSRVAQQKSIATGEYISGSNKGYIAQDGTNFLFAANRDPVTGTYFDSGKASVQLQFVADNGDGSFIFYTTNTNNSVPTAYFKIDKDGDVIIIDNSKGFYFGDKNTNGSWRKRIDGADLVYEKRESGTWVEKNRIVA